MRQDSHLREEPRPLIFADSIEVGGLYAPPLLMTEMLVSERLLIVNAQSFVGTLASLQGNITAQNLYPPTFGRASLYVPKTGSAQSLERVKSENMGPTSIVYGLPVSAPESGR